MKPSYTPGSVFDNERWAESIAQGWEIIGYERIGRHVYLLEKQIKNALDAKDELAFDMLQELKNVVKVIEQRSDTPLADLVDFCLDQCKHVINKAEGRE